MLFNVGNSYLCYKVAKCHILLSPERYSYPLVTFEGEHDILTRHTLLCKTYYRTKRLSVFYLAKCEVILGLQSYCYIVATATATITDTNQTNPNICTKYLLCALTCAKYVLLISIFANHFLFNSILFLHSRRRKIDLS